MATKKAKQKMMKRRAFYVARVVACVSFAILAIIGVSSVVRAMSLEQIANENGVPEVWQAASLWEPETITLPITYWNQKADACDDDDRQFEWTLCDSYRTHGVLTGMVKPNLGRDRLPVPAFSDKEASWSALHDALSVNVIGQDPVRPTDNFYRWFHEVPGRSERVDGRTVTFQRTDKGTYVYGGQDIYPIDDVPGIDAGDVQLRDWQGKLHNFNFTAHLGFAIKVNASGEELFEFSGDDDVWVFLNNKLVLDIGGLHGPISGWFKINADGTVTTFVEKVNNLALRDGADWADCMRIRDGVYASQSCITNYNTIIRANFSDVTTQNLDFGLEPDEVVNLDFFYAERSTDGSNTKITVSHMNWPISADSKLDAEVVGRIGDTESNLISFNSSITNRDPDSPLDIERIAAYINEETDAGETSDGFLPLSEKTLFYTATPEDEDSWKPVALSAPDNSMDGFKLETPLRLTASGSEGDTLYFRYFGESSSLEGEMSGVISYYTSLDGLAGVTFDHDEVAYTWTEPVEPVLPVDPVDPDGPTDPFGPSDADEPSTDFPDEPVVIPPTDVLDEDLVYLPPLGEVAFVPNTGLISDAAAMLFETFFADAVLSQGFVMATLLIFAGSFAVCFSMRKYAGYGIAKETAGAKAAGMVGDKAAKTMNNGAKAAGAGMTAKSKTKRVSAKVSASKNSSARRAVVAGKVSSAGKKAKK